MSHLVGTEQELQLVLQWLRLEGLRPSTTTGLLDSASFYVVMVDGWALVRPIHLAGSFRIDLDHEPPGVPSIAPWLVAAIVARLQTQ